MDKNVHFSFSSNFLSFSNIEHFNLIFIGLLYFFLCKLTVLFVQDPLGSCVLLVDLKELYILGMFLLATITHFICLRISFVSFFCRGGLTFVSQIFQSFSW